MKWLGKPRGLQPHASVLTYILRKFLHFVGMFFNSTVDNREAVPETGRVIVACNHISILDPLFLWGALRRNAIAFAKKELWRVLGVVLWLLGHIPVKRGDKQAGKRSLTKGKKVLEHEGLVFIYPEQGCSKDGELLPFKVGVAVLAFETNSPVVPAYITGTNLVKPLYSWRINRKHPVNIRFGEALRPENFTGENRVDDFMTELRRQMLILADAA